MTDLERAKRRYDRVLIKYTSNSCEVLIVDGLNVYRGLSRCHEKDTFNRKLGRTIALGRAEFAAKLARGEARNRDSQDRANMIAYQNVRYYSKQVCDNNVDVDQCIINFLPKRNTQEAV
jgi:hypothetical protein